MSGCLLRWAFWSSAAGFPGAVAVEAIGMRLGGAFCGEHHAGWDDEFSWGRGWRDKERGVRGFYTALLGLIRDNDTYRLCNTGVSSIAKSMDESNGPFAVSKREDAYWTRKVVFTSPNCRVVTGPATSQSERRAGPGTMHFGDQSWQHN